MKLTTYLQDRTTKESLKGYFLDPARVECGCYGDDILSCLSHADIATVCANTVLRYALAATQVLHSKRVAMRTVNVIPVGSQCCYDKIATVKTAAWEDLGPMSEIGVTVSHQLNGKRIVTFVAEGLAWVTARRFGRLVGNFVPCSIRLELIVSHDGSIVIGNDSSISF